MAGCAATAELEAQKEPESHRKLIRERKKTGLHHGLVFRAPSRSSQIDTKTRETTENKKEGANCTFPWSFQTPSPKQCKPSPQFFPFPGLLCAFPAPARKWPGAPTESFGDHPRQVAGTPLPFGPRSHESRESKMLPAGGGSPGSRGGTGLQRTRPDFKDRRLPKNFRGTCNSGGSPAWPSPAEPQPAPPRAVPGRARRRSREGDLGPGRPARRLQGVY